MSKLFISSILILILTNSCYSPNNDSDDIKKTLKLAGSNKDELVKVLEYFDGQGDTLEIQMARFLIKNMPGHYSYDTTILSAYRPILFQLDSLIKYQEKHPEFGLTENINRSWYQLRHEVNYLSEVGGTKQDYEVISSEYLIEDIKKAADIWRESPYSDRVTFENFCEYVLPYRSENGISIENWRSVFYSRHIGTVRKTHPLPLKTLTDSILKQYKMYQHTRTVIPHFPYLKYRDFEISKRAECETRCWYNSMVFASIGIPVAIDQVPAWGNRNGVHWWNALVTDNQSYPFESFWEKDKWKYKKWYNNKYSEGRWGKFRLPKVFRRMYSINKELLELQEKLNPKDIPSFFRENHYKDVSEEYFETISINISLAGNRKDHLYAYLCVYNYDGWVPVQWGKIQDSSVTFLKMGRDIVYLPAYYKNGRVIPASNAFYIDEKGQVSTYQPVKDKNSARLTRKYFNTPKKLEWHTSLTGAKIEASNRIDFKDATPLFTVQPDSSLAPTFIKLNSSEKKYRYVRFLYEDKKRGNLADLSFYTLEHDSLAPLKGLPIYQQGLRQELVANVFDNDLMTYMESSIPGQKDDKESLWIGLDLLTPKKLDALSFCVRNDGNSITDRTSYELFYWDNQWQSLGVKKASKNTNFLLYNDLPKNTIFLLKDLAGGREERIFTIDKNGNQVWR